MSETSGSTTQRPSSLTGPTSRTSACPWKRAFDELRSLSAKADVSSERAVEAFRHSRSFERPAAIGQTSSLGLCEPSIVTSG